MSEQELELEEVITLVDEDGQEQDFEVIDIIHLDGSKYAVLLPVPEVDAGAADDEEGEAIILRFETDEEGNEILVDIEDDEEWEKVADYWEEMIENEDS
ncbi:Protein of unknown function [Desulfofundulus australicus DSM 11792]|jgi:uncharacterized protein YrzB (UPF0473 family)|uniref:UPF0473 protein SAMN02745218_01290 n=1 Tax=Desulfofundulus australicus DSM 11792 TaxID=1121425 RepID=A0A1M4Y9H8_9FIRM|nr:MULTISPECIES: DUF1292 domain-containing protein [Desulfofundulus]SHF02310.1 Protein of unknown function [Desulfofundulus australicus DSM 11792]